MEDRLVVLGHPSAAGVGGCSRGPEATLGGAGRPGLADRAAFVGNGNPQGHDDAWTFEQGFDTIRVWPSVCSNAPPLRRWTSWARVTSVPWLPRRPDAWSVPPRRRSRRWTTTRSARWSRRWRGWSRARLRSGWGCRRRLTAGRWPRRPRRPAPIPGSRG